MSRCLLSLSAVALFVGCSEAEEASRVRLEVVADPSGLEETVTTDLGYDVELESVRVVLEDLQFAIAGEAHSSLWPRLYEAFVPSAHAHPGHFQAGDVTGELSGHFVVEWSGREPRPIGTATLLAGRYQSANFELARASSADELSDEDPLLGHTAVLVGEARRGNFSVRLQLTLDSPSGRQLTGVPFEHEVKSSSTETLGLRFLPRDMLEGDTVFDGIDFLSIDVDGDGDLQLGPDASDEASVNAYNQLRRTFQTHDHFDVQP
jgi:hypothetical protein